MIQVSISATQKEWMLLRASSAGDDVPVNWNGNLPMEWTTGPEKQEKGK